jgi:hypothetical protein
MANTNSTNALAKKNPEGVPAMQGGKRKTRKSGKGKRKLSSWNLFVMKVKKANPSKSFKEVLKMAATMKKKGQMKV